MRVYHFANAAHALSNIALRRMKVSRFADLNDPFELIGADMGERTQFLAQKNELNEKIGVLCFSKDWWQPVLWSHYADKHRGICLGFDVTDCELLELDYIDKPLRMKCSPRSARFLLRTKYSAWTYEEELRWVVKLKDLPSEDGLFFMPFSSELELKEVILGPRCSLPAKSIRELVAPINSEIQVKVARLDFSSFRVVESTASEETQRGQVSHLTERAKGGG